MEPVTVKKFCLLTPKSMPEEVTRRLKVEIEQHIASFAKPFTLTLSLDHWKAEFPRLGGWKEWQAALAGNSPMTGKPSFDAFIAPEGTTGRATSDIVATAVGRGASLFVWLGAPENKLVPGHVVCTNPGDMKAGWTVSPK